MAKIQGEVSGQGSGMVGGQGSGEGGRPRFRGRWVAKVQGGGGWPRLRATGGQGFRAMAKVPENKWPLSVAQLW